MIIFGAIGLIGLLLYALIWSQPKAYNWNETYANEGKQPYDIGILTGLLDGFFSGKELRSITNLKYDTSYVEAEGSNLIYIDGRVYIDSTDADKLMAFAAKGNTVFISASNAHSLLDRICRECGTPPKGKWIDKRKAKRLKPYTTSNPRQDTLAIHYQVADELVRYPWPYFNVDHCDVLHFKKVGGFEAIQNDYTNFLEAKVGEGRVLLHCTPLMFTNYHMIKPGVLNHTEQVLAHLPEGDIYLVDPQFDFPTSPNRPLITESPLRFILGNDALRWAWYLILALSLLYVLSTMRRKQKSMQVITRPENEALKFVDVMSRFFQKEGKHKDVVSLQLKLLLNHLRRRYRIAHHVADETFYREAAVKLNMEQMQVTNFFKDLNRAANNSTLTDKDFIAIDKKITEFYAKCP